MFYSIGIVEDNAKYSEVLKNLVNETKNIRCEAVFENIQTAQEAIPALDLDLLLVDIHLPDGTGIELIKKLKKSCPKLLFIMCTSFEDTENIFNSLKAGAIGYIIKSDVSALIVESIYDALNGGAPMSPAIAKKVIQFFHQKTEESNKLDLLSKKESEILTLLSKGLLYKEIADIESISIDTVKKHIGNIYKKLEVCNRTEAINLFFNR